MQFTICIFGFTVCIITNTFCSLAEGFTKRLTGMCHSYLSESAGFEVAARQVTEITVNIAIEILITAVVMIIGASMVVL
jgi:hypothetical protein